MKNDFSVSLKNLAGKIDDVIASSTFPCRVKPDYLGKAMQSYPANGGKRLRPVIMLWSAALAGGDTARLFPAAAALEIFHNWTLVHDDIIDDDDTRRGKPTAHIQLANAVNSSPQRRKKFGSDMAILAGDLMQGWAFELIDQSDIRPEVKLKAAAELRHYGYIRLVSGEAVDVAMSYCRAEDITEAELFEMQSGKTGALLHYAARAGWMLGREDAGAWDDAEAKALGEFGEKLALAFQMRDDYLGIFGNFEEFGKPIGSDLAEGKATVLLLHALKNLPDAGKERLKSLLYRECYTVDELEEVRRIFTQCCSTEYLLNKIAFMTHAAQECLAQLPDTPERKYLSDLADYLINREK
ncbi:MAG: polyprenyl synthetase family protein [Lentisphaerae bacterium]|nr:polyprenyl synthetase family protein [Lentisphaerota bacterium]